MLKNFEELLAEKAKEMTLKELEKQFGFTAAYLRIYMNKRGIQYKKVYTGEAKKIENIHMVEELAAMGYSREEIAEQANFPKNLVLQICHDNRIRTNRKRNKQRAERNEMIKFLRQKYTLESIGDVFGMTRQHISKICMED